VVQAGDVLVLPSAMFLALLLILCSGVVVLHGAPPQTHRKAKLPRPQVLDSGIVWKRDPATGELSIASSGVDFTANGDVKPSAAAIQVVTHLVALTCSVSTAEGEAVPGLTRADFRVFDNGAEQNISYFDASSEPASVAMVIDASPSVLRDSEEIKKAADALVGALAPLDQAAVVDFSAHTYLQLPFSDVRELIRQAVARVDPRTLLDDTGGSHIYEAVYLAAHDLFPGRKGRKSIVLLTDGEDSGLGLSLDPTRALPQSSAGNRLTFDDVAQILAREDIQVFAVSTENRPKVMTPEWLASHKNETLATRSVHDLGIPTYTLYLAELVRRAGGQLYFLRETPTMADSFRQIAAKIRAEYTLGYYPSAEPGPPSAPSSHESGRHELRVEVTGQSDARVSHRAAYYVPAVQ
jgi:Ca-activated chloride channel family protein